MVYRTLWAVARAGRQSALGALVLLAAAGAAHAAADGYPVMVYPCERAEAAPALDGRLDEPAWAKAPVVSGFTYYNRNELATVQTSFRAVYDDAALYLGVRGDEPEWRKLSIGTAGMRDAHGAVFGGEAVEVFVDPKHDHAHYHQIAANLDGGIYDTQGNDPAWNGTARAVGAVSEGGWTLEICLPWRDFDLRPAPGTVVGLNVCRDRNLADRQWTTWSQIDANFHDPPHFGHLVLSPTPQVLAGLSDEFRKGGLRGPIRVFGPEGFSGTTYLALAAEALRKLEAALAELDALRKKEGASAVATSLEKRIAGARAALAPVAEKVKAGTPFDGAEWIKTDTGLQKLRGELEKAVWDARLEALLGDI